MKKLFVCGAIMLALSACKSGWSSADKEQFKNVCMGSAKAGMGEEKAKSYCDCFEEKVEKKYPTKTEADKANTADITQMSTDCMK